MATSTPARLYCTLVGAALVIGGIIGFFYSSGFGTGTADVAADTDEVFGLLAVNGWHNLVHLALGLLGLYAAGRFARTYALAVGLLYIVLAIWGLADTDNVILGLDPARRRGQRPAPDPRADRPRGGCRDAARPRTAAHPAARRARPGGLSG